MTDAKALEKSYLDAHREKMLALERERKEREERQAEALKRYG